VQLFLEEQRLALEQMVEPVLEQMVEPVLEQMVEQMKPVRE
jgi:hypothetical protein